MNNPAAPLDDELERIAAAGFDFVDLTLEPAHAWPCDGERVGRRLRELGLAVVGHTAFYLPVASPFPELREETRRLFGEFLDVFAAAGAKVVNVHPQPLPALFSTDDVRARNAEAIALLVEDAAARGLKLAIENMGRTFSRPADLAPLFAAADGAAFHLDVGHAHMGRAAGEPERFRDLLDAFGDRLVHVHVHDNLGVDDLHLPLGSGRIDWPAVVSALKNVGYDGTVTLEVFDTEPVYVDVSLRLWREWWASQR